MRIGSGFKDLKTKSKSSTSSPSNAKILKALTAIKPKHKQSFQYPEGAKASSKGQSQQPKPAASAKSSSKR